MKAIKLNLAARWLLTALSGLLLIISFDSCSKKIAFDISTVVPGAEGQVKIKKDKNKNYSLDISVKNLAEPKRLTPPKETYVVWMETERNGDKNLGQINIGTTMLSKVKKGSLSATTPFKPVRVFITAEETGDVMHPGMDLVLTTRRF
jgi:hypothetical protein